MTNFNNMHLNALLTLTSDRKNLFPLKKTYKLLQDGHRRIA